MNILIVRLGSLGDIIHALPVAAALRARLPAAKIDWLVDARYRAILDYVPLVDRRLVIRAARPGAAGEAPAPAGTRTFSGWRWLIAAVGELRHRHYDVALDLQGLVKSAALASLSRATRVIGFAKGHVRERAAGFFYTERVDPAGARHVVDKNLSVLGALGITGAARQFPLEVPASRVEADVRARLGIGGDKPFALINPCGGWPNKRWPASRYGAVAAALRDRHGLGSAVLWGPREEELAHEVVAASRGAAVPAPPTTVADLITLSRAAALMVSGDTGPLHIAAAGGTPLVGIFGPTDPARNGPFDSADVTVSQYKACVCHYQRRCRRRTPCLADISVEDLVAAIDRRLASAAALH